MASLIEDFKPTEVILSGIAGTSLMTLFSYLVSETNKENFREPELLGKLLHRALQTETKENSHFAGWNLHYLVGVMFAFAYSRIWEKTTIKPSVKSGSILGLVSGILGMTIWKICFTIHPNPPKINFKKYYGHLLITHVIFGVFTAIAYKLSSHREKRRPIR
jgi:hypothetical protein